MKKWMVAVVLATMVLAGTAHAADFAIWFGDAAGTNVASYDLTTPGPFTAYIWMTSAVPATGISVAVQYDNVKKAGTAWTALQDNKITLTSETWGSGLAALDSDFGWATRYLRSTNTTIRPYGVWGSKLSAAGTLAAQSAPVLVATLQMNATMPLGSEYEIKIYDAGSGDSYTTFLNTANGGLTGSDSVLVRVIPEPGSLLALGTGLIGLAGFAIRRRK